MWATLPYTANPHVINNRRDPVSESLNDNINLRVNSDDKDLFIKSCEKKRVPYAMMLREMIEAINAGNLRIVVKKSEQTTIKGIHECR